MKKIAFLILLLTIHIVGYSQTIGGLNKTVEALGGLRADSAQQLPPISTFSGKGIGPVGRIAYAADSLPAFMKSGVFKKILTKFDSGSVYVDAGEVGQPNGVASLNGSGVVPSAQLPAITINGQVFVDTNMAEMLSHVSATAGALSIRVDSSNELFVLVTTPSSVRGNWHLTQGNGVSAFNGRVGAITPRSLDYKTDSIPEGVNNLYYTNARVLSAVASDTAVVSGARLADSMQSVRGSGGTLAIGANISGATNGLILFNKGTKLGQDSRMTYDTVGHNIDFQNAFGHLVTFIGSDGTNGASVSAYSDDETVGVFIKTSPDGASSGLTCVNGTGVVHVGIPLGLTGGYTQYLRPKNDSFAYLSDILPTTSWVHLATLTFSSFSTGSTTRTINTSYTLPPQWVVNAIAINQNTSFSGGSISGYTISIGGAITGNTFKYLSPLDVFSIFTSPVVKNNAIGMESFFAASAITATATSTGANLSSATQGSVDIYLLVNKL